MSARQQLVSAGSHARSRWRSSLRLRVVATTLLASGLVVALLASLIIDRVGDGLVQAKTRTALTEAQSAAATVRAAIEPLTPDQVERELNRQIDALIKRGAAGNLYTVVQLGTGGDSATRTNADVSSPSDVPEDLVEAVADRQGRPSYVFAEVPDGTGGRVEGIVVGSEINVRGQRYQLFQLFPMTEELQTLGLLQRTAALAGLALVVLLALIAYVIVRQVVTPVRLVAATAQKIAAGNLEERLVIKGEDELARLGDTFNTMAESLQKQIGQLEELSRVQRRFVSDVSHELRTPLTTVRMAADLLHDARQDFPADTRRSAELLQAELDRFEALLANLLEISRYDAGATSLDAEDRDLVALVEQVLTQTGTLADRTGSAVELEVLGDRPVLVEVDPVRVERVLRNLVVNALEHGEGRPVQVVVFGEDQAASVVVRDHGVGLRAGEAERVFTRFWRGDPSRARTTGGTGLGLAIALEDARLHGGQLQAWGQPGIGAAFRLTLPRVVGGQIGPRPPLGPAARPQALR